MIGKISGIFSGYYNNIALIDVYYHDDCFISYEIIMKNSDILSLTIGSKIILFIKEIIKEDENTYYGFIDFEEKCFFEEFIKLSGLGPKIALSILSTYSCDLIIDAINANDCSFFSAINGIGSKLANRIPNEIVKNIEKIQEKIINFGYIKNNEYKEQKIQKQLINIEGKKNKNLNFDNNIIKNNLTKVKENENKNILNDAISALVSLGFSKQIIYKDVLQIVKENNELKTEDIIKEFFKKKD